MTSLTSQNAIDILRANTSYYLNEDNLIELIGQIKVEASGSQTIFYGGYINGIKAEHYITALVTYFWRKNELC